MDTTITFIESKYAGDETFRVVGPLDRNYGEGNSIATRGCPSFWCEFSIYNGGTRLSSWGGPVWPANFPNLFRWDATGTYLTPEGLLEVAAARKREADDVGQALWEAKTHP